MTDGDGLTDTATVSVTVTAVNDAPDAVGDSLSTSEDTPVITGDVLSNDWDLDGDTIEVDGFTQPAHGTVSYNGDGDLHLHARYELPRFGTSFTYTVSDGAGGTDTGYHRCGR